MIKPHKIVSVFPVNVRNMHTKEMCTNIEKKLAVGNSKS